MSSFTRRNMLTGGSAALLGTMAGVGRSAGGVKSKRDLMQQVLNMQAKPGYVPAGFFMHFEVKGDAAVVGLVTFTLVTVTPHRRSLETLR